MKSNAITLAITGASGAIYALKLIEQLLAVPRQIRLVISDAGYSVLGIETQLKLTGQFKQRQQQLMDYFHTDGNQLCLYDKQQWSAPIASGSNVSDSMVVCPCSMGTLAAIASGLNSTLLHRAADVTIKEGRQLILVPRETPLSSIHLENMLKLSRLGVLILAASPGFYHQPATIDEMVNFIVARILDQLSIAHQLVQPWGIK